MLAGQAGDEVEIRLAVLVHTRHLDSHRAHRLPAVAGGDLDDDALQRHLLPAAAADGFASAAQVAGLAADHQGIGWAGQLDFVNAVAPQAAQGLTRMAQLHFEQRATGWQGHSTIAGVDAQFEFVGLKAGFVGGA